MNEVVELAKKEIKKRNPLISRKKLERRAEIIGLGALKFQLLKLEAQKDMHFNPKESISFEGETAPFIQYACVRGKSILEKSKEKNFTAKDFSFIETDSEKKLLKALICFPEVIKDSIERLSPHLLAQYLLALASAFNAFYRDNPVLNAEKQTRMGRLAIVKASAVVLENGLNLLGIKVPKRM
jgi:arginyl-tRNA synthetase